MSLFNSALFPPVHRHTDVITKADQPIHKVYGPDHLTSVPISMLAETRIDEGISSNTQTWIILGVAAAILFAYKMK